MVFMYEWCIYHERMQVVCVYFSLRCGQCCKYDEIKVKSDVNSWILRWEDDELYSGKSMKNSKENLKN